MRFRFNTIAESRQWSSAASTPRLNRLLKCESTSGLQSCPRTKFVAAWGCVYGQACCLSTSAFYGSQLNIVPAVGNNRLHCVQSSLLGTVCSICARNPFFFVRNCANSSLRLDRLICLCSYLTSYPAHVTFIFVRCCLSKKEYNPCGGCKCILWFCTLKIPLHQQK